MVSFGISQSGSKVHELFQFTIFIHHNSTPCPYCTTTPYTQHIAYRNKTHYTTLHCTPIHITPHHTTQQHTALHDTHIAIDPIFSDSNIYFGYSPSMVSTVRFGIFYFFLNLKISTLIFFSLFIILIHFAL
jgi:hypothetical protein